MPDLPESGRQPGSAPQRPAAQPIAVPRQGAQAAGLPAAPKQASAASPGQAARAARQRKRKVEPEVVDERQQRLQKRMVRTPWALPETLTL